MMLAVGAGVAAVEERPVTIADVAPIAPFERDARLTNLAPLLLDLLPLLVIETAEKIVEAAIARIRPVKLHAVAEHHAATGERLCVIGDRKQAVERGHI